VLPQYPAGNIALQNTAGECLQKISAEAESSVEWSKIGAEKVSHRGAASILQL